MLFVHPFDDLHEPLQVIRTFQTAFGSQFRSIFRDKRYLIRTYLLCYLDDRLRHRHLEIKLAGDGFFEDTHIAVIDMPAVLPEVDGNPVCTGQFALHRCPDRVRLIRPSGLTNRCHMIDIDIEYCHANSLKSILTGHYSRHIGYIKH
jgi:hypothetical protein